MTPRDATPIHEGPAEILFVCVHNAGRSQMAAAFARELGGSHVVVRSAGSDPADRINSAVAEAMREVGVDLSTAAPRRLDPANVQRADVVVTMGCGDACPIYPATRYLDWIVDDPAGKEIVEVRRIRDEIRRRVVDLLAELRGPAEGADASTP